MVQGPTVLLVQQGSGTAQAACPRQFSHAETFTALSKGNVFFVPCDTALRVSAPQAESLLLWIAGVNSSIFAGAGAAQEGQEQLAQQKASSSGLPVQVQVVA